MLQDGQPGGSPGDATFRIGLNGLIGILVASLILQRFGVYAGTLPLPMALLLCPLIVIVLFVLGVARISSQRLMLFALLAITSAIATAISDPKGSPFSGLLYTVLYAMFIFCVPVDKDEHLRAVRLIVRFITGISIVGIAQYVLQYVIHLPFMFSWKGIVPANLLIEYNTLNEVSSGSGIYKSNGFFLLEASAMSQLASRGLLLAIIILKDLRYVPILGLAMLLTFSGTGMLLFLFFGTIPLIILLAKDPRFRPFLWLIPAAVPVAIFGLWDQLNLGIFLARIGEFTDPRASGYARFTGNFFLFLLFSKAEAAHFFFGTGPAMAEFYLRQSDAESFASGWIKLVTEYGVIGFLAFCAFFYTCAYQATRRHLLAWAFLCHWLVLDGNLLVPQHLFVAFSMCAFLQYNPAAAADRRRSRQSVASPDPIRA